jgi:myo-inositol-1(or 4)-monophosphatase
MSAGCPTELIAFGLLLARESGDYIRPLFGSANLRVDSKSDASPVTQADRGAEELMRALIAKHWPSHGVLGEEFGETNPQAEYVWVLDPIDGTISFVAGCPLFGTLIGLLKDGEPVFGIVHQPVSGQLLWGDGIQAVLNGRRVRVQEPKGLRDAVLLTTDIENIARHQSAKAYARLAASVRLARTWGDCYGYLLLASGGAHIMMDPILMPWDLLPLVPVLKGAGAVASGWDGGPPKNSLVAAPPALHARAIEVLNYEDA